MSSQLLAEDVRVRGPAGSVRRPLLIVDDDELELCLLADRLGAAGFAVSTASSGTEAQQMLSTGAYPVVITDYQMPGMDGLELVEQARTQEDVRSYFIMWTIRAAEMDRQMGFDRGVDDYVSKQTTDNELLARIEAGFSTVALRQALQRTRDATRNRVLPVVDPAGDVDGWQAAASRLHADIARARRYRRPLSVMMLQIEHALASPDHPCLAPEQVGCLVGAVNAAIRHPIDWAMPVDVASGLARIMLVFPETDRVQVDYVRRRLLPVLTSLSITDEFAELAPECSVGITTIDTWSKDVVVNAATMVAAAEEKLERLGVAGC